jgi:hypothetical protein
MARFHVCIEQQELLLYLIVNVCCTESVLQSAVSVVLGQLRPWIYPKRRNEFCSFALCFLLTDLRSFGNSSTVSCYPVPVGDVSSFTAQGLAGKPDVSKSATIFETITFPL